MTTSERDLLMKLAEEFGEEKTLKELLSMNDNTPIEEVKMYLQGVYKCAYELTGEVRDWSGTIKDIIIELYDGDPFEGDLVELGTLLTEEQLNDFTSLFFGNRRERCVDYIKVTHSRDITTDEVKEYLRTLRVSNTFYYDYAFIDF